MRYVRRSVSGELHRASESGPAPGDGSGREADTSPESGGRCRSRDEILLDAEVDRLVHELRPFGVLRQEELAQRTHAGLWQAGTFRAALQAGARRGELELLPFDFVCMPRSRQAPTDG